MHAAQHLTEGTELVVKEGKRSKEKEEEAFWEKRGHGKEGIVTWLILPVVICLSQRLSHACVSINSFVL